MKAPKPQAPPPSVLIAGDTAQRARVPIALLRAAGYSVSETSAGVTDATVAQSRPTVVVLFADGPEAVARVAERRRRWGRAHDTQVLVVHEGDPASARIEPTRGADDFVFTPINPHVVRLRVDQLMRLATLRATVAESHERLAAMAVTDELTGLINQGEFRRRIEVEVRRIRRFGIPVACVFFDCDHFKRINDTHGHEAGSQVLRALARLVADNLRDTDTVARYGGDEFVIAMPGCGSVEATAAANRLAATVREQVFAVGDAEIRVTLSLGVAAATPTERRSAAELLEAADQALYEAKRQGRDRVFTAVPAVVPVAAR